MAATKPVPSGGDVPLPAAPHGQATNGQGGPQRLSYKENRELASLERDLPLLESQRRSLEERLSLVGSVSFGELEALSQELAELVARIHSAEERWLHLSERLG
jgi:ATP-binding cassette subfamily F protein uup